MKLEKCPKCGADMVSCRSFINGTWEIDEAPRFDGDLEWATDDMGDEIDEIHLENAVTVSTYICPKCKWFDVSGIDIDPNGDFYEPEKKTKYKKNKKRRF